MRTIISQGLALFLISTAFLASASPIASDPKTLVQHNSLVSANSTGTDAPSDVQQAIALLDLDDELSDSTGLNRRGILRPLGRRPGGGFRRGPQYPSPVPAVHVPIIIQTSSPPQVPEINYVYGTPLEFMKSLDLRRAVDRRQRIEHWKIKGVKDLRVMMDRLRSFDFPMWLIHECEDRINAELEWATLFWSKEARNSDHLMTINQHVKHLHLVKEKLAEERPSSPASFYEEGEEEYSSECESQESESQIQSVESGHPSRSPSPKGDPNTSHVIASDVKCKESENQTQDVHGHPLRSPSPQGDPNTSHVIASDVNELHIKARRERIDGWNTHGIELLKEKLATFPTLGFPGWLVYDECEYEIIQTLSLAEKFLEVEQDEEYLAKIKTHRDAMNSFHDIFYKALNDGFFYHQLPKLMPKIGEGGQWRQLVKDLADNVKNLHMYTHSDYSGPLYAQIHSGLDMCREILRSGQMNTVTEGHVQLKEFRKFLTVQRNQVREAERKFDADQPGIGPTRTQSG
ncbi:hypothetical protein H0H93_010288 [Arthromyces matolae]|nr:hypothetical protein H0H93_010288 [Arthromyces matolae]